MLLTLKFEFNERESITSMQDMLDRAARGEALTVIDQMIMRSVAESFRTAKWKTSGLSTKPLTKPQRKVLDYVKQYSEAHGLFPALGEISAGLGYKSDATSYEHLLHLAQKGYIVRIGSKATPRAYAVL